MVVVAGVVVVVGGCVECVVAVVESFEVSNVGGLPLQVPPPREAVDIHTYIEL